MQPVEADPRLRRGGDPEAVAGPAHAPDTPGEADAVWLTAESLGDDDPALLAHPQLPAVFVFDAPLLGRLQLAAPRLVFLAECLADLAQRREVRLHLGAPAELLAGQRLAATYTPVPGWRRLAGLLRPVAVHPWPWLRRPTTGPVTSFSAWRR
jgi:deoxyribodipyrimidine photo-lyase